MKLIPYTAALGLVFFLTNCGSENTEAPSEARPDSSETDLVTLTAAQYRTAGITLGGLETRNVSGELKVNGMLDVPPQNLVSVSPPVGGFLKSTPLLQGMRVRKGHTIAIIENMDFIQLQQDYLDSKSQLEFLEAEYRRQGELNRENVNAVKTLQQAKAQYESTLARVKGLQAKLRLVNLDPARVGQGDLRSTIPLRSPIDGFVTQVHGNLGAYVNPTDVLFQIVDPTHLHVELSVFERDIPKVKPGQKVRFILASETRPRTATVFLVRKEIEPDRSVGVHCHLDQEDRNLLPGTYLQAWVETNAETVPALPETAVVNAGEQRYVFVMRRQTAGQTVFARLPVQTGRTENGWVEIVSPPTALANGRTVLQGAYHLWAKMNNVEE